MIGIIFDVVFVGFIASLFVNIVLSVKLFDVTKYNKMLIESAKGHIERANSLTKDRGELIDAYTSLKWGLAQELEDAPKVGDIFARKESHDIPRR